MVKFGNTIKRYREQGDLTVDEVAFKLKVSVEIVVLWENDELEIELDYIKQLVEIFNITLEEFYDNLDTKEKVLKSFIVGGVVGLIIFSISGLVYRVIDDNIINFDTFITFNTLFSVFIAMFITQLLYKSWLRLLFAFFVARSIDFIALSKSVTTSDCISLIIMKLTFGLSLIFVAFLFFLIGLIFAIISCPFSYIYEIFKNLYWYNYRKNKNIL